MANGQTSASAPTVTEWDAQGNPISPVSSGGIQEWDAQGNPITQAKKPAQAPSVPSASQAWLNPPTEPFNLPVPLTTKESAFESSVAGPEANAGVTGVDPGQRLSKYVQTFPTKEERSRAPFFSREHFTPSREEISERAGTGQITEPESQASQMILGAGVPLAPGASVSIPSAIIAAGTGAGGAYLGKKGTQYLGEKLDLPSEVREPLEDVGEAAGGMLGLRGGEALAGKYGAMRFGRQMSKASTEIQRATRPADYDFPDKLQTAAPHLAEIERTANPSSMRDAAEATHDYAENIWGQVKESIARHPGDTIQGSIIANSVAHLAQDPVTAQFFREEIQPILHEAARYNQPIRVPVAEDLAEKLNARARSLYNATPESVSAREESNARARAYLKAADSIRTVLADKMTSLGEQDFSQMKQDYGAMRYFHELFRDATPAADRIGAGPSYAEAPIRAITRHPLIAGGAVGGLVAGATGAGGEYAGLEAGALASLPFVEAMRIAMERRGVPNALIARALGRIGGTNLYAPPYRTGRPTPPPVGLLPPIGGTQLQGPVPGAPAAPPTAGGNVGLPGVGGVQEGEFVPSEVAERFGAEGPGQFFRPPTGRTGRVPLPPSRQLPMNTGTGVEPYSGPPQLPPAPPFGSGGYNDEGILPSIPGGRVDPNEVNIERDVHPAIDTRDIQSKVQKARSGEPLSITTDQRTPPTILRGHDSLEAAKIAGVPVERKIHATSSPDENLAVITEGHIGDAKNRPGADIIPAESYNDSPTVQGGVEQGEVPHNQFVPLPHPHPQEIEDIRKTTGLPLSQEAAQRRISERTQESPLYPLTNAASDISQIHTQNGGATYNLTKGNLAGQDLYAVGAHPDRSMTLDHPPTEQDIQTFIDKNRDLLSRPDRSVGTWAASPNRHVLDVVATVPKESDAMKIATEGRDKPEEAIYHLGGRGEIKVPAKTPRISHEDFPSPPGKLPYKEPEVPLETAKNVQLKGETTSEGLSRALRKVGGDRGIRKVDIESLKKPLKKKDDLIQFSKEAFAGRPGEEIDPEARERYRQAAVKLMKSVPPPVKQFIRKLGIRMEIVPSTGPRAMAFTKEWLNEVQNHPSLADVPTEQRIPELVKDLVNTFPAPQKWLEKQLDLVKSTGKSLIMIDPVRTATTRLAGQSPQEMLAATLLHETGHKFGHLTAPGEQLGRIPSGRALEALISEAKSGVRNKQMIGEVIAEAFSQYAMGKKDELHPDQKALIESLVKYGSKGLKNALGEFGKGFDIPKLNILKEAFGNVTRQYDNFMDLMETEAVRAEARLAERKNAMRKATPEKGKGMGGEQIKLFSDPTKSDYQILGASKIWEGDNHFSSWSKTMSKEYPEIPKGELRKLFEDSRKTLFEKLDTGTLQHFITPDQVRDFMKRGIDYKNFYQDRKFNDLVDKTFGKEDGKMFKLFFAATGQGTDLRANTSLALKAFAQWKTGEPFDKLFLGRKNVERVARGEEIRGPKIRPYAKIAGVKQEKTAIPQLPIDRRISRIFFGTDAPNETQRKFASQALTSIGKKEGLSPNQAQAAFWKTLTDVLGTAGPSILPSDLLQEKLNTMQNALRSIVAPEEKNIPSVSQGFRPGAKTAKRGPFGGFLQASTPLKSYGSTTDISKASFVMPDGTLVPRTGEHRQMTGTKTDEEFSNELHKQGAMRIGIRQTRAGKQTYASIPGKVTPEQVSAIKRAVGQNRNGALYVEIAKKNGKFKSLDFANVSDVEPALREIGALPKEDKK